MKIVKESLNEIVRGKESGIAALGLGKNLMIKQWADQNFDEYKIIDDVIYPKELTEYPSVKWVQSGKIPDYIKIIAFKPYELLKLDDIVINYNESAPGNEYRVEEIFKEDKKTQREAVTKAYGEAAYISMREQMDNNIKVIRTSQYDDLTDRVSWQVQLYDYTYGVIGTFIYNGEKI